ncbi:MAG: hypothetical protein KGM92_17460 [Acidobacteriota bacterium]|nr:hypothetical protein [Acidobacteriota bacterium]
MLNKAAINVQQCLFRTARAPCEEEPAKRQGNTDLRVRRTRERFGAALSL